MRMGTRPLLVGRANRLSPPPPTIAIVSVVRVIPWEEEMRANGKALAMERGMVAAAICSRNRSRAVRCAGSPSSLRLLARRLTPSREVVVVPTTSSWSPSASLPPPPTTSVQRASARQGQSNEIGRKHYGPKHTKVPTGRKHPSPQQNKTKNDESGKNYSTFHHCLCLNIIYDTVRYHTKLLNGHSK
jgi:hypothetical protein